MASEGLSDTPKKEWPDTPAPDAEPMELLKPGSPLHSNTLEYLLDRLEHSERMMTNFYDRWQYNERRLQAYIDLPDYEKILQQENDAGKPANVVSITVPYAYATISTIVTYYIHTFTGRKPIFQVDSYREDAGENARTMEQKLQFDADHTRLVGKLHQWLFDGEVYGVGVMKCFWMDKTAKRTVWKKDTTGSSSQYREERTVYQGNEVENVDPFLFFPDPSVPMHEVPDRGEFVFWRQFHGKHYLKKLEASGEFKYVDTVSPITSQNKETHSESARGEKIGGFANAGDRSSGMTPPTNTYQVDQGTIEIIPRELGLGESEVPEKWIFTILNKKQIVQAQRFGADHDMHPVTVIEPYTFGYGFGQPGMMDFVAPLQDTISWFINSHMHNVRAAINNMFVVDPSKVEMQDILNPEPGKVIRLKRASYGMDVREAVHQFQIQDITRGHIADLDMIFQVADALTGVTDNLRGLQDAGGRKTATEVRTAAEAGASRLAAGARVRSSQGLTKLAEMMSLNNQQYLTTDFAIQLMGQEGAEKAVQIAPEHVVGDFYYPIHDGTLPLDRVALLDVWKEILLAVMQDQGLRQEFDVAGIFDWTAELGGAKNLDRFKLQVAPEGMPMPQEGVVPANLPGVRAGNRAAGALA